MLKVIAWIAQAVVAVIFLQTLFFKVTYAPETQAIFADLGGRPAATLAGLAELVAAALLLTPARVWRRANALGAALALNVIGGAIATHVLLIEIAVPTAPGSAETDGGALFAMALLVAVLSSVVLVIRRAQLPVIGPRMWTLFEGRAALRPALA